MGSAYTPGLKVSASTTIRKSRRLPLKGDVVVELGEEVQPGSVVARTNIPGILRTVRASERLSIEPDELPGAVQVRQGQDVTHGTVLAESRSFFGIFKTECKAPVDGCVEIINTTTGHISIREKPNPIEVTGYIQGIFGVGGERRGAIRIVVKDPGEVITADHIQPDMAGLVIAGGSNVTADALRKAYELGVAGIVVGAIIDRDLIDFLGYDIGVAITGHENIHMTLVLTEGFGQIRMADRTFRLLNSLEGQIASINGATQIRAGVIRPEVIVPHPQQLAATDSESSALDIGTPIRIIREPYFGQLASVTELPSELQEIPSGAMVRVLLARLQSGEVVVVPRANVEIIEE